MNLHAEKTLKPSAELLADICWSSMELLHSLQK